MSGLVMLLARSLGGHHPLHHWERHRNAGYRRNTEANEQAMQNIHRLVEQQPVKFSFCKELYIDLEIM